MRSFIKNTAGATMIEYGMIVALISVVLIAVIQLVGENMSSNMNTVGDTLSSANATAAPTQ